MRVTVFGAAGGTGRHVVDEALAAGHEVTVLVRDPQRLGRCRSAGDASRSVTPGIPRWSPVPSPVRRASSAPSGARGWAARPRSPTR